MHFDSTEHLHSRMKTGVDVARFAPATEDVCPEYFMLQHDSWGLVPVQKTELETLRAQFSYFYDKSEDMLLLEALEQKLAQAQHDKDEAKVTALELELAEWRAEMDAQADKREAFRDVVFSKE